MSTLTDYLQSIDGSPYGDFLSHWLGEGASALQCYGTQDLDDYNGITYSCLQRPYLADLYPMLQRLPEEISAEILRKVEAEKVRNITEPTDDAPFYVRYDGRYRVLSHPGGNQIPTQWATHYHEQTALADAEERNRKHAETDNSPEACAARRDMFRGLGWSVTEPDSAVAEEASQQPTGGLTPDSLALFDALVDDAGNWSGTPLVEVDARGKGNLSDLKRKGLLTTSEDDGCTFAWFTRLGAELAAERGQDSSWWPLSGVPSSW